MSRRNLKDGKEREDTDSSGAGVAPPKSNSDLQKFPKLRTEVQIMLKNQKRRVVLISGTRNCNLYFI